MSIPVTFVKVTAFLSFFRDSSHTCPLRMAVRVRPLACLRYPERWRVVGAWVVMAVFSLQWEPKGPRELLKCAGGSQERCKGV